MTYRLLTAAATVAALIVPDAPAVSAEPGRVPFDVNAPQVQEQARTLARKPPLGPVAGRRIVEDHSGRKQAGKASFYAPSFQNKTMADGHRFNHAGQAAASKTLPLGTVAR